MRANLTTLCNIERDDAYLMLHRVKKEQDVNKDIWIGVGGHLEEDESPEECLFREGIEETGLTLLSWKLRGVITVMSDVRQTEYMFLYTATGFLGELKECPEGNLEWVRKEEVRNLPIWEGDKIFFDLLDASMECFSLKLRYKGEKLAEAVKDGNINCCANDRAK